MCIAIAKMANNPFPSMETLHTCWTNNDDGAGFAYPWNGQVRIQKGYMSWKDFEAAIEELKTRIDVDKSPMLLHFRIATHGNRDATMTHPFPIQFDEGALMKPEYSSDYAVIHNGIISMCSGTGRTYTGLSDTATYVKDYLTLIATNDGWLHNKQNMELIYKMISSKMAIMDKTGFINMTTGFEEHEGNFYSNTSYKENRYRWSTASTPTYTKCYGWDNDYSGYSDYSAYGITHYDFTRDYSTSTATAARATRDADIYDFTHFDSDYDEGERGLMEIKQGYTVSVDGMDYLIEGQKDSGVFFIDRKRNVWERVTEQVTSEENGIEDKTVGYVLMGEDGRVYDINGQECAWNADIREDHKLFVH